MSKSILDNLFGSRVRVKILKLLFRQHPASFNIIDLTGRTQEPSFIVRRELGLLQDLGMVRRKTAPTGPARERERWNLNEEFDYFSELRALVLKASPAERSHMAKRISGLGKVRLAVLAGIFLNSDRDPTYDTPADLFIVGDEIDKSRLAHFLKSVEAEMGTEIRFGLMEKEEFKYRYEMFDRFLRVLLEGPHEKIINKLGL